MQGTLFTVHVDDDAVEYTKPTGNRFDVRYTRHRQLNDDEISVRVRYQKQPAGIQLRTNDGDPIQDGDEVPLGALTEPSNFRSDESYESGRLAFTFDITDDHKPAMAWDEVEFTLLFRGDPAKTFTRRFGGYPNIHDDYNPETGEYEL